MNKMNYAAAGILIMVLGLVLPGPNVWGQEKGQPQSNTSEPSFRSFDGGKYIVAHNPNLVCSTSTDEYPAMSGPKNAAVPKKPAESGVITTEMPVSPWISMKLQPGTVVEIALSASARGKFGYKIDNTVKLTAGNTASIYPVFPNMSQRAMVTDWEKAWWYWTGCWSALSTTAVFQIDHEGTYNFGLTLLKAGCFGDNVGEFALRDLTLTARIIESPRPAADVAVVEDMATLKRDK